MRTEELKIIYLCRSGSHAYGTSTDESDEDIRGVAVAPIEYYLGHINRFEQKDKWEDSSDRVVFDIQKFCKLASDCNPNVIELLWINDNNILEITGTGRKLIENRNLFLSKKARYTFTGYAFAQLKRIRTHRGWLLNPVKSEPTRKEFGLPESRKLITEDHMNAFLWMVATLIRNTIEETKLSHETIEELRQANLFGLLESKGFSLNSTEVVQQLTGASENFIESVLRERAYANAMANWHSYQTWQKGRNPKRAVTEAKVGYDTKHVTQLVRLCRMCEEILSGKGVIVKRPDAEELLAIKNGAWTFEQIEEFAENMDKRMDELYKTSTLPRSADHGAIEKLCIEIIMEELKL